ncbi:hypothetical protein ACIRJM_45200 [Streptomyces sp. NPDC102405]|uniref:hypothetical protein n=1 Tax=Streptomyces sp. NPDC102405 TaxID=3366170 RepID=UPI0037F95B37
MTTERYVEQFLRCALEASGGDPNEFLDPEAIMGPAQLDMSQKNAIVSILLDRRYVSNEGDRADGSVHLIKLTGAGLEQALHLSRISHSKTERDTYLHNVLVRWAYEHTPAGGSASLQEFAGDDRWWFAGTQVTWDEVDAAVDFLVTEKLLAVERAIGHIGIRPTPLGIKFAHSNQTLRFFMTTQPPHSPIVNNDNRGSITVHGDASGSALVTGDRNTVTLNQGLSADALAALVTQLREVASSLGLAQDDAEDLAAEIDNLEQEGAEPARGRRIWRAIMRIVAPAVTTAAAAGADQAVQAAITAGSDLFN